MWKILTDLVIKNDPIQAQIWKIYQICKKNVTFQMVFVKNESGRIRVRPQPLYILRMNTNAATFILHENRLKIN